MKVLSFFMCLCITLGANAISIDRHDAADTCFLNFIESELQEPDALEYVRTPLYNFALEESGWQYTFTAGSQYGFALVNEIRYDDSVLYEIEEVYFNETSPYANIEGLPIYVTFNTYIEYKNESFYDINSGLELDRAAIDNITAKHFGYRSNNYDSELVEENIAYTYKDDSFEDLIPGGVPLYTTADANMNCANVAGAVMVGYLDSINENMIANYTSYISVGGKKIFKGSTAEMDAVTRELVIKMNTDSNGGTTYAGFINGMNKYASDRGLSLSYASVMSATGFDFSQYVTQISQLNPVVLFLDSFTLVPLNGITVENGYDHLTFLNYHHATHVVVGFGYKRIRYYNGNNIVKEMTLLRISSNFGLYNPAYINVNGIGTIDKAISIMVK